MNNKPKKKRMRSLTLKEVSPVDFAAMDGADFVLAKRGEPSNDQRSPGGDDSNSAGPGHNANKEEPMATKNAPAEPKATDKAVEKSEDVTALETKVAELEKRAAAAESWGNLTDVEKAFAKGLDDKAKAKFVAKSDADRAKDIEKANEADPVVFTSSDGTEFRKSDDSRLVKMAKERDADREELRKQRDTNERQTLEKRATDELGNLPGKPAELASLVKAVDGIEDEAARNVAKAALKAANDAIGKAFESPKGISKRNVDDGSPLAKLESMAKAKAAQDGKTFEKAFSEIIVTQEGRELYEQYNDERAA